MPKEKAWYKVASPLSLAVCFAVATGLWLYAAMNETHTIPLDIPLRVAVPENQAIENTLPKEVRTKIKGKGWQLFSIVNNLAALPVCDVRVQGSYLAGGKDFIVSNDMLRQAISLPSAVTAEEVYPDSLKLKVGQVAEKQVDIDALIDVVLRDGYQVGSVILQPKTVTVRGNARVLKDITTWKTKPISTPVLSSDFRTSIELSDSLSNILSFSESTIQVLMTVQQSAELVAESIPIELRGAPEGQTFALYPSTIDLVLVGSLNDVRIADPNVIKAWVDFQDVVANGGVALIKLDTPLSLKLRGVSHRQARVRFYEYSKKALVSPR